MTELPFVSIVIPCYNEAEFICKCLDTFLSNDYPSDRMEVIVVDGMSFDGTREILDAYSTRHPAIKVLTNAHQVTPNALNIGIKAATGECILRADAHARYPADYVRLCVVNLLQTGADNVGGTLGIYPRDDTDIGRSIALSFAHVFGSGGARYKTGQSDVPQWVDTVPFGCYRRTLFDEIGYFDERLVRSQDMEFNKRIRRSGGLILLVPEIESDYYVRSTWSDYLKHNLLDGIWAVYPYRFVEDPVSIRHLIPLFFVSCLMGFLLLGIKFRIFRYFFAATVVLYSLVDLYISTTLAVKEKSPVLLPLCFISFLIRHIGYGSGSLYALPRTLASLGFWKNRISALRDRADNSGTTLGSIDA